MQADDPWRLLLAGAASHFQPALQHLQQTGQAVQWQSLRHLAQLGATLQTSCTDLLVCLPDTRLSLDTLLPAWQDTAFCPLLYVQPPEDKRSRHDLLKAGLSDSAPSTDTALQIILTRRLVQTHRAQEQARLNKRNLEDTEASLHHLLTTSPTPCAFLSEGLHLYANAAYHEWLGYASGQLDTLSLLDLVAVDERDTLRQCLQRALRAAQTCCLPLISRNGSERPALIQLSPGLHRRQACVLVQLGMAPGNEQHWRARHTAQEASEVSGFLDRRPFMQALEQAIRRAIMEQRDSLLLSARLNEDGSTENRDRLRLLFRRLQPPEACCGLLAPDHLAALLPMTHQDIAEDCMIRLRQAETDWTLHLLPINRHAHDARQIVQKAQASHRPGAMADTLSETHCTLTPDALTQAISQRQFALSFQPFVPLRRASPLVHEVVATLTLPEGPEIGETQFVPLAARHLLSTALDECLIDAALSAAAAQPEARPVLAFTPSQDSLENPRFIPWLCSRLRQHALEPAHLVLLLNARNLGMGALPQTLVACQQHGFPVSVTELGETLLPLALLRRLNPLFVSLDTATSSQLAFQGPHLDNTRRLVQRLQAQSLSVAATQVENPAMLAAAWELGLDRVQGEAVQARLQPVNRYNSREKTITARPPDS